MRMVFAQPVVKGLPIYTVLETWNGMLVFRLQELSSQMNVDCVIQKLVMNLVHIVDVQHVTRKFGNRKHVTRAAFAVVVAIELILSNHLENRSERHVLKLEAISIVMIVEDVTLQCVIVVSTQADNGMTDLLSIH